MSWRLSCRERPPRLVPLLDLSWGFLGGLWAVLDYDGKPEKASMLNLSKTCGTRLIFELLGCSLGAPLRRLGGILGRLGGLLGRLDALLRLSWGRLGRLGALLGCLRAVFGRLGAVLGASWAVLGRLGAVLGASWAVLGRSWGPLGPSWNVGKPNKPEDRKH